MNTTFKNFSDIKVGDNLYWSSPDMDYVSSTLVTDIHLELDGEHLPKCCEVSFTTIDSFNFSINNLLLNRHNLVVFTHKVNGNTIYIGTEKEIVATHILRYYEEKINLWKNKKSRFIKNVY